MSTNFRILVQQEDFDHAVEYERLRTINRSEGAIVTFTGLVRDFNQSGKITGLVLEHYPGMTEKSLFSIAEKASQKWSLGSITIIHRVGVLQNNEQIVFVGVSSRHRESGFEACQFIMDYLKNEAPFWKKETSEQGDIWVEAKASDKNNLNRWQ